MDGSMKAKITILIILAVLLLAALACIGDPIISYADQTATAAANHFNIQLTAMAATETPQP